VPSLGSILLDAAPEGQRDALRARADLDAEVAALVARGRAAWPAVALAPERFARHVGERLAHPLEAVQAEDLYLACACLAGDPAAIAAFDAHFLDDATRLVQRRMGLVPDALDEARQRVRVKLLVGEAGLASYSGRGPLLGWLRVTLAREAARVSAREEREDRADPVDLADTPAVRDDPELEHLKRRYGDDFRASFEQALAGLGEDDVQLLRFHYVESLSIDAIGVLLRIHRATAARRLAAARQALVAATREAMRARLRVDAGELESILRVIESQVHVSVVRLLSPGRR
jgi:RNA polymerase sigma-70 factor, ECF subfamily